MQISTIIDDFHKGHFHECFILYNFFKSVIAQEVKTKDYYHTIKVIIVILRKKI